MAALGSIRIMMNQLKKLRALFTHFLSDEQLRARLIGSDVTDALNALEALKERRALQEGTLTEANLAGANLPHGTFARGQLNGVDFSNGQLQNAYFYDAQLQQASFANADLRDANFRAAQLAHGTFEGATLLNANFSRAMLIGAILRNADLRKANFWRTDLRGADLQGARLDEASLIDVVADETTILPDGTAWTPQTDWSAFTSA